MGQSPFYSLDRKLGLPFLYQSIHIFLYVESARMEAVLEPWSIPQTTEGLCVGAKLYAERSIPTLAIVKCVCVVAIEVCPSDV